MKKNRVDISVLGQELSIDLMKTIFGGILDKPKNPCKGYTCKIKETYQCGATVGGWCQCAGTDEEGNIEVAECGSASAS